MGGALQQVMQRQQRNVQKSVMHMQSCCFANLNLLFFAILINIAVVIADSRAWNNFLAGTSQVVQ